MYRSISEVNFFLEQMGKKSLYSTVTGFLNLESLPTRLPFHPNHRSFDNVLAHPELFSAQYLSLKLQGGSHISLSKAVNKKL
jgi:hypothetical protein